jgi:hypothetical protein
MFRKKFIIGVLATFFFMGFLGTAFAENSETSLIGTDQFTFDAPASTNNAAASKHVYNQEQLALVGTEAGVWEFKFDAPETKAELAAKNYVYDQEHLASVGTEGGNWEFKFDAPRTKANNANEAVAEKGNMKDAVCKGC